MHCVLPGCFLSWIILQVVFGVSIVFTVVMALDALLKSKQRWRQLRGTAHSLESVIWLYRTRVDEFELQECVHQTYRISCALTTTPSD